MDVLKREKYPEGTIEWWKDDRGLFRFRVKGNNGEIVVSSEGYVTMSNARRGLATLKTMMTGVDLGVAGPTEA